MDYPHSIRYDPDDWRRRTAAEILGPPGESADPNDSQLHGWDPDGPGDRQREERP